MRAKILAFVGAGCTGKTTLLEAYRERFRGDPRLGFVSESARQYFENHPMPERLRFTATVQGEIQSMAMAAEQHTVARSHLVMSDRSVLDAPIYVQVGGDPRGARVLMERARPWLPAYSQIFLLDPADIEYEQDAVRQETDSTREQLHAGFLKFFNLHSIEYTLLRGGLCERMNIVDEITREAFAST